MLQEASTRLITPDPSDDLIVNEPWTIETYADGLMDDLFADIDDILDGNGNYLSAPTTRKESTTLQTVMVKVPQIVLPSQTNLPEPAPLIKNRPIGALVVKPATVTAIQKHQQPRSTKEKLLFLGAIFGIAASIIYLWKSGVLNLLIPQTVPVTQPQSQLPIKKEPSAELVSYMLASMEVIDKQETNTNQISAKPGLPSNISLNPTALTLPSMAPTGNLPPLLTANNTLPGNNRTTNVVERIYIPVYQAPSPMRYTLPTVPGIAGQGLPSAAINNNLNAIQPSVKPAALAALPVLPLPIAPPRLPTAKVTTPLPTTISQISLPSNPAQLEGLLELGNKSAALFKIDSVTHQINLGESIGATGWTLVEVSHREAIIRRNGEVRSIYPGQKF
jgi:hypothetical protein